MQKERGKDAIRLTNRTAIALRRSARRIQKLYVIFAVVLTVLLTALSVILGLKWLIAVPIVVTIAVMLDMVILIVARSHYLSLTGQAICTEAAARQMRADRQEKRRRRQALSDLEKMKEDVIAAAGMEQLRMAKEEEEENPDFEQEEPSSAKEKEITELPRRRRQASFQVIHGDQAK